MLQVYAGGRGLAFHFDKDERAMQEEGRMITPLLSSVLYLTGTSGAAPQAPTVILDQRFDHEEGCPVPEDPTCATLVFPRCNAYCLFDGALGHGVLESGSDGRRATLLVNWWAQRPAAVLPPPACDAEAPAPPQLGNRADAVRPEEVVVERLSIGESDVGESDLLMVCTPLRRCRCRCRCRASCGASLSSSSSSLTFVPAAIPRPLALQVDYLLQLRGLQLVGDAAVQALTIHHPGLALYPVDGEQLRGGEVQVGAAFLHLSAPTSSSSGEGSEGGEQLAHCRQ